MRTRVGTNRAQLKLNKSHVVPVHRQSTAGPPTQCTGRNTQTTVDTPEHRRTPQSTAGPPTQITAGLPRSQQDTPEHRRTLGPKSE